MSYSSSVTADRTMPLLGSYSTGSVAGVSTLPLFEVRSKRHNLVALLRQPRYKVSPSHLISPYVFYRWRPHPASTSSALAMRLCGISGTLKAHLAAVGSFASRNSNVSVVHIVSFDGVPRDRLGAWVSATL